ncbi:FMN-binding protein [Desulfitobacterium hafniense]|uniref:FMN-binding protein n=1 Tax=Desulfitobacterium hafniense TaxID=49338 RepID=UPI00037ABA0A|nr:FMN-binding protein [Desulfitobacterium hafniense]
MNRIIKSRGSALASFAGVILSVVFLVTGCGSQAADIQSPETQSPETQSPGTQSPDTQPADTSAYKDGTYQGSSDKGVHPGLKVEVAVKDGKIAEVNVVENNETVGVGSIAVEQLPGKIVEAQSTDVDSISGASLSSAAIKEAVDIALEHAKK